MGQSLTQKKILFVITRGEMGGAQRYVFDLAANLSPKFKAVVAIGKSEKTLGEKLAKNKIKVHSLSNLVRNIHPLKDLRAISELKDLIEKEKPDIVHLNSSKAGVVGSIAAYRARVKNVVFTAHGFAFLEPRSFPVGQIYFWAEKIASRFRKKIITLTSLDREEALKRKLVRKHKIVTIQNGIKEFETLSREQAREKLKLKPNDLVIGSIAHDYKTKDLPALRKAFEIIKSDFKDIKLVIIGKGSEYGEIPNAKKLLKAFDIYALSSVKEGHPYSLLEAMQAGLPIVATRVGGVPETITHNRSGLIVEPKDPIAFAEALQKLLKNPGLREQLALAAKTEVKKFTIEEMVNKTEHVYSGLLN